MEYTIKANEQFNSNEIYFTEKPCESTRDALKSFHFRWNRTKGCWYGYASAEDIKAILSGDKVANKATKKTAQTKKNKYGVKVGDFFHASWGYEQTNNDFFQVIALVGESSVRVREVSPEIISRSACSGMSEDRVYKLDTSEILPPTRSIFIDDQEKGDLKRLKSYAADGISNPRINVGHQTAYYCETDTLEAYESWYA